MLIEVLTSALKFRLLELQKFSSKFKNDKKLVSSAFIVVPLGVFLDIMKAVLTILSEILRQVREISPLNFQRGVQSFDPHGPLFRTLLFSTGKGQFWQHRQKFYQDFVMISGKITINFPNQSFSRNYFAANFSRERQKE